MGCTLCCLPKKLDRRIAGHDDVDGVVILIEVLFTYERESKNIRHTQVPDRYLDLALVLKLDLHRAFLGVHDILYRVDERYIRNRWALHATSFLALLVLQPFWNGLCETHLEQSLL